MNASEHSTFRLPYILIHPINFCDSPYGSSVDGAFTSKIVD